MDEEEYIEHMSMLLEPQYSQKLLAALYVPTYHAILDLPETTQCPDLEATCSNQ